MAIKYTEEVGVEGKPKATIEIDNGDLQAMKEVMASYKFIDQQALLRYALVALISSDDNKLYIRDTGNIVAMTISENLLNKNAE